MRTHRFLRRKAASQYLEETWGVNRAPSTLAKYAVIGGGPTFRRAGRVPSIPRMISMNGLRRNSARRCVLLRTRLWEGR